MLIAAEPLMNKGGELIAGNVLNFSFNRLKPASCGMNEMVSSYVNPDRRMNQVHLKVGTCPREPQLVVITVKLGKQHLGKVTEMSVRRRVVEIGVEGLRWSGKHLLVVWWKLVWLWRELWLVRRNWKGNWWKLGGIRWIGLLNWWKIRSDSVDWGWGLGEIEVEGGGKMEGGSSWVGAGKVREGEDEGWEEQGAAEGLR